ncbi:MAG: hypothetical protein PHV28_11805 [Kiritimatiellae bacterium]|nr:hypothetical protein [Kiritimatiellia bacterium]
MRGFNEGQQEFERRRLHFKTTRYSPVIFGIIKVKDSLKSDLHPFRSREQPHGESPQFLDKPCVFAMRQIKHPFLLFRNLEKNALKHESLGIVTHAMRFMRLRHKYRAWQKRIHTAVGLKREISAKAQRNLDTPRVNMLFCPGPRHLKIAQSKERNTIHPARPKIERPPFLPVDIGVDVVHMALRAFFHSGDTFALSRYRITNIVP